MDTTIDTASTDLVVVDDSTALTDSDEGTSNAAIGAICIAAGVAIGTFVVPPVVNYVKSWFASSPDVPAQVTEIMAPAETSDTEKAV